MDGSVDENSGLKYTVGDKSPGILSTSIDKALGGMLLGEETQLKCSPEYAQGANIDLILVQVAKKHDEKAISDKTATEKAESENVVAESVKKAAEDKMTIAKSTVANVAAEEGTSQQETHGHITTWCRCECTAGGSGPSPRANVGDR